MGTFVIQQKRILKSHIGAFWKEDQTETTSNTNNYRFIILVDGKEMEFTFYSQQSRDEEYERLEKDMWRY